MFSAQHEAANVLCLALVLPGCPWCAKVRELLASYGLSPWYVSTDTLTAAEIQLACEQSGYWTWPKVWYKGAFVGGYEACVLAESKLNQTPLVLSRTKTIKARLAPYW